MKKNLVFIVRRGDLEFYWIAPVIKYLKRKFNIYLFFLNKKSLDNLDISNVAVKYVMVNMSNYFVYRFYYNIIDKILFLLFTFFFKNKKFVKTNDFFLNRIHNYDFIKEKLKISGNIDLILSEYSITTEWLKQIHKENKTKIIHYPNSPQIFMKKNINPKQLVGDKLIINSKLELNYWKKNISKNKIFPVGSPQHDRWWLNKHSKNKLKKKKIVLFAYNSLFGRYNRKQSLKNLEENLFFTLQTLYSFKNIKVYFKVHPFKNHPKYKEILKKFPKNFIEEKKENLNILANNCDLFISMPFSSTIIDSLYVKKPSLTYFYELYEDFYYQRKKIHPNKKMGLEIQINRKNFANLIKKALYNKNNIIWKNQVKNFQKYYDTKNNASYKCYNEIIKILKN